MLIPDALWNMRAGQNVFKKRFPLIRVNAVNLFRVRNGAPGEVFERDVGTMDAAHSYLTDNDPAPCPYEEISFGSVLRCGLEKFDLLSDETS